MKIVTGQAFQERDIAADSTFLAVPWQIMEGETMLLEGSQAFPLTASQEDVEDFLNKKLATYQENVALNAGAETFQAEVDNAQQVTEQISNLSIGE